MPFMMDSNSFDSHSLSMFNTADDPEISQRLGLYQVFLRLYENNRGLLDEILNLEKLGIQAANHSTFPFIQGMVVEQQVFLVTNLIGNKTQALKQVQRIWTIGRDSRKVVIPIRDARLSRSHAAIEYINGEGFYLIDLGSSNGSYVNGEPIRHHTLLREGDRVRLGSFTFTFLMCDSCRTLGVLTAEMLSKISIAEVPPTIPIPQTIDVENAESGDAAEEEVSKVVLDDTSSYQLTRNPLF